MNYNKGTTSGTKRKSSGSAAGSFNKKKIKVEDDNAAIFSMENHCIQAILKYLPIQDLANVCQVSHFFKINAIIVFNTVHAATIKIEYDGGDFSKHQMVFRRFGSLATKVIFSTNADDDGKEDFLFLDDGGKILRTIGRFCGSNLKHLALSRLQVDLSSANYSEKNRVEIRNILAALNKLALTVVCIKSPFLTWTRSLKELSIHSCCHMEILPELITLPHLKILQIGGCLTCPFVPRQSFNEFLQMNPSIEEVNYHFRVINVGHLESICSLPKLTNLTLLMIHYDGRYLSRIARIARNLKTLKITPTDSED